MRRWWSQAGSNRWPPACKAGALPAELWPLFWKLKTDDWGQIIVSLRDDLFKIDPSSLLYLNSVFRPLSSELVGLSRLELPTSPLSGVRSNQLSYRPGSEDGKLRTENSSRITSWWFIFNFTINTFMPNNKIKKQSVQLAALKYRLLPSVFRPLD